MIVAMKKATIIVQQQDAPAAVKKLSSLGVMHIQHQQPPQGEDINALQQDNALVNAALAILSMPELDGEPLSSQDNLGSDWKAAARHIIETNRRFVQLQEYSRSLNASIAQWQGWGDFEPEDIMRLAEKNIFVSLYAIPRKEMHALPPGAVVKEIYSSAGTAHCVVVSQGKISLPFREISLPKMGLNHMQRRLGEDVRTMNSLRQELRRLTAHAQGFRRIKDSVAKKIEYREAVKGMGQMQELSYVRGFIPFDKAFLLGETAKKERWGLVIDEPAEDDAVPTLIRTPGWVSLINPVFKLIEVIPGYREFDISLWFLVFISLFFGILIGDAGYGLVYFVSALFLHRKFRKKMKDTTVFFLVYLLSGCAMIWGTLTATFFGQEWLRRISILPPAPALTDDATVRQLCFFIGALHLTIAHLWRMIVRYPALTVLAEAGWISILWSAFFLARFLILGSALPWFFLWMLTPGMLLVLFFSSPKKNIFRASASGLGTLLLNLMNNFTDVVSYIRLFAVGLAAVALADAFNAMAISVKSAGFIGAIASVLIIVAGHSLNIILGPMSVLVHGVRLNVLEFCSHLDVKWNGFAYRPLTEG